MGKDVDEDVHINCPFHGTEYCIKTGVVTKWCERLPDYMPAENKAMITAIKRNSLISEIDTLERHHVALNRSISLKPDGI